MTHAIVCGICHGIRLLLRQLRLLPAYLLALVGFLAVVCFESA